MDSTGSTATPTGGLAGVVLHAVSPLFAGGALLEVTAPGVPEITTAFWPRDAGPHRHRRVAAADIAGGLGGETFDVALVRTAPGAAGDAAVLRAAAGALDPGGLLVLTLIAAGNAGEAAGGALALPAAAAALAAAGLHEVAGVVSADLAPAVEPAGPSQFPERVVLARPGPDTAARTGVRDAGVVRLLRLQVELVVEAAQAAHDRREAAIEITRLTTTLRARDISLTRRVERADRNAERWEQRYEQLRNRPALRLASAVSTALRRARDPGAGGGPGAR